MRKRFVLPEWFKIKKYPHVGTPPLCCEYSKLIRTIKNPDFVKHHAFLPLVRRSVWVHKNKVDKETGKKKWKQRNLTYASHIDALIYSYYAFLLQKKYNERIARSGLHNVSVAYRKIKCDNEKGNKCNIHFALDAFTFVGEKIKQENELAFMTFDITGFFDNLDHKLVKSSWAEVLGYSQLPDDVYAVFKNVTKYSFVKEGALFSLFKNKILCKTPLGVKEKKITSRQFLKEHNAIAYCHKSDIKKICRHKLIEREQDCEKNLMHKGIPQGLPISAVIANVYMLDFDMEVNKLVTERGGLYKRYSDDIVVVCKYSDKDGLKKIIKNEINKLNLEIQDSKTNTHKISKKLSGKINCEYVPKPDDGDECKDKPIEYLGFSYDGSRILLKSAGLCKYYSKLRRDVARHRHWALHIQNKTKGNVFVNQIVKRFTLAGSKTLRKKNGHGKIIKTYGNYLTYVKKASMIMKQPQILGQLGKNLSKVNFAISKLQDDVNPKMRE